MPEELTIGSPDSMLINMGPQHPSTHGVIRFILDTDGEVVSKATPVVGYLHRGIEKIATEMTYAQFMPLSDRLDYVASMNGNFAWCEAVERMAGIEVPRRAEFLRVIAAELNRISSHLVAIGAFCNDVGAVTPLVVALREREAINDLLEMLSGARLTYNYMRIGGVSRDMTDRFKRQTLEFLDHFPAALDEYNRLITGKHQIHGQPVDLANIRASLLNIVAKYDHLVAQSQSETVMDAISSEDKELRVIPSTHVGIMASGRARYKLWPEIVEWLGPRSD